MHSHSASAHCWHYQKRPLAFFKVHCLHVLIFPKVSRTMPKAFSKSASESHFSLLAGSALTSGAHEFLFCACSCSRENVRAGERLNAARRCRCRFWRSCSLHFSTTSSQTFR